jgi:hypothetical protein
MQWNLSKPILLGTNVCVWYRQVDDLYRLTKIIYIGTLFKVQFIQDSVKVRVQIRQVSLYYDIIYEIICLFEIGSTRWGPGWLNELGSWIT